MKTEFQRMWYFRSWLLRRIW